MYLYIFFVCKQACTRKIKIDSFGLWPTERGRVLRSAIYSTYNGFFLFGGAEKTKKSCSGEAGRRDGWQLGVDDGGGASRRAAGRLVVVVVRVCGASTIKVCNCTAFMAWSGGGDGYFCTV